MILVLQPLLLARLILLGCGLGSVAWLEAQTVAAPGAPAHRTGSTSGPAPAAVVVERDPASPQHEAEAVKLDTVEVKAATEGQHHDATGMGSYEYQLRDLPFSNDLISATAIEDDPVAKEVAGELAQVATPSAVDLATGDSRVSLRGFPSPLMSNGFARMGGRDVLNISRTIVIQGALVPVLGRAAPGGILDYVTSRPRTTAGRRFDYSRSSLQRQAAAVEFTGPAVPKRVWQRLAMDWSRKLGPEAFAASETRSVNGSVTWRHSAAASTLFAVDFSQLHATSAPGLPEYRRVTGGKIVGPYRPIAGFNSFGPEAGVRRRSTLATILFDGQPHPKIAVRAGVEAWWRQIEQDRFTTSLLNLATKVFEGIREPRHSEQPQHAWAGHAEATGRFSALGAEHKVMAAASHTWGINLREEWALPIDARNALPASVRIFNPAAPNYSRPAFSRERYNRILTDREEQTTYTALELTERVGIAKGRWVFTVGLRRDEVGLKVHDRRPGATMPQVRDRVDELTSHFGVNYQALPSRLLLFATASTAFEPSTRVDARTGRIQGNDTTRGYEAGLKGRFPKRLIEFTLSGFTCFNQDISRRNPLYDDPIFDANHTQPQLVAAGEERFTGGKFEGSWRPRPTWTLSARASYVRAITTASPDLPEEVGRALTRMPPYNAGVATSYGIPTGTLKGLSLSTSWSYISSYTAQYEDKQRHRLDYPGYGIVSSSAYYSIKRGKFTHGFGLAVRNVLDADLLASQARVGQGREWTGSYRLMF
jgi:iron complex outermembrane receptor protein